MKPLGWALAFVITAWPVISCAAGGPLSFEVSGVRFSSGSVRVDVCTPETFLKAVCAYSSSAPATAGTTTVVLANVPPGVYAAQVYHDWNDNHQVDRKALGIPKEGLGFSNNAALGLHGPSFASAAFTHNDAPQTLSVKLHHFSAVPKDAKR
ncbi:MAG: DUF2141 domain-containing protein [Caulobacteraceae bacterium]